MYPSRVAFSLMKTKYPRTEEKVAIFRSDQEDLEDIRMKNVAFIEGVQEICQQKGCKLMAETASGTIAILFASSHWQLYGSHDKDKHAIVDTLIEIMAFVDHLICTKCGNVNPPRFEEVQAIRGYYPEHWEYVTDESVLETRKRKRISKSQMTNNRNC